VVCRDSAPSDITSDSDTDLTVPFVDDSTEEEEKDADCVYCIGHFSDDHNVEEWKRCAKYFRWRTNFVLVWRKILFVSFIRDENCFVLPLYL
jgi:hypothetical protein